VVYSAPGRGAPAARLECGLDPRQQADVERAIAAAEEAGVETYRIEIDADGRAVLIVGVTKEEAGSPDRYGDLLD
jgi:hypothetical protein